MKIQFYVLFNGRNGYLKSRANISWTVVTNPLLATIFADYQEAVDYVEKTLNPGWTPAFYRGTFAIANVIEEL